jgi:hypothetical protein
MPAGRDGNPLVLLVIGVPRCQVPATHSSTSPVCAPSTQSVDDTTGGDVQDQYRAMPSAATRSPKAVALNTSSKSRPCASGTASSSRRGSTRTKPRVRGSNPGPAPRKLATGSTTAAATSTANVRVRSSCAQAAWLRGAGVSAPQPAMNSSMRLATASGRSVGGWW